MAQPILSQPILVGILGGLFAVTAAILGLIGVLWKANTDFKLGKRTAAVAEQTAEDNRAKEVAVENKGLREEIKLLRKETWETEQGLRQEITEQRHTITEHKDTVAGLTAQLNVALRGQERAEGGLVSAQRTIEKMCPPSETKQLDADTALILPPMLSLPPLEHRQEAP